MEQRAVSGLLAVLLALLGVALMPPDGPAHAAETDTFKVEPSPRQIAGQEPRRKFVYSLGPGDAITDAIRITNKTEQPQRFRVYGADAERDPATGAVTVETYSAPRNAVGSWIDVENQEVLVEPHASEVVAFTLRMPDRSQPQGLGAVVVEQVKEAPEEAGIDIAYRVALTVQTTGGEERLHVAQPTLDLPIALIPARGRAHVELRNGTLRSVSTTTRFVVEGVTGTRWELEPVPVDLAPGETKLVEANWTNVPRWGGVFRVRAEATWEAGKIASTSPRQVFPPLWLLALVIVAIGIRGLREMWARHQDRRERTPA